MLHSFIHLLYPLVSELMGFNNSNNNSINSNNNNRI